MNNRSRPSSLVGKCLDKSCQGEIRLGSSLTKELEHKIVVEGMGCRCRRREDHWWMIREGRGNRRLLIVCHVIPMIPRCLGTNIFNDKPIY